MMKRLFYPIFPALLLVSCIRPDLSEERGVVVAASPEATEAGTEILRLGGNAVDAAVAVSFALGVTEPAMSGLGGGTQILLAIPGKEPVAINGTTFSPVATPIDATSEDLQYHRRTTIPSTVKVLQYIWKKYGSGNVSWADLLQPAVRYAEEGFEVGLFRHKVYKRYEESLRKSPYATHSILMPDGTIPAPGDIVRQPVLANTLKRLATHGASDFYQGEIAQRIAADMTQNGGWITLEDLQQFPEPREWPPLKTTYRGYEVFSQPPPCGGWTVLQILNILEKTDPEELQAGHAGRLLHLIDALYLGHSNRRSDPVYTPEGTEDPAVARKIDKTYAQQLLEEFQTQGVEQETAESGETTHFSVVDAGGMAVAVTASINAYFGAKAAAPDLGFLYNTYMDDFELGKPEHPFAIRPHAMAYSSMSPTIVRKDGKTVLVIGSPGSARIISAVSQLTQLWIDDEQDIEKVVASPRTHVVGRNVYLEDTTIPHEKLDAIRKKGYQLAFPGYELMIGELNAYFGGIHAIARQHGTWVGAADPRRDGTVGRE